MNQKWQVTGVDLAWGNTMPDAMATGVLVKDCEQWTLSHIKVIYEHCSVTEISTRLLNLNARDLSHLIAIDAPLICQNNTGSRPVDKECSTLYRKYEAGCHPVNLNLVNRPIKIADQLREQGVIISKNWQDHGSRAIEVYPHPAMIHWFKIEKTIKYKKGRVSEKRVAFGEYQNHLKNWLEKSPFQVKINMKIPELLNIQWSKRTEDELDAFFCLLIACWEVIFEGKKSLTLGNNETGFIVIPKPEKIVQ